MSAEPVETLVERVREALESERDVDVYVQALAALTELAERLETLHRHDAAATEDAILFRKQLVDTQERLKAAERERDEWRHEAESRMEIEQNAPAAEARVAALEEALRAAQAFQPNRVQWFRDNGIVFHRAPLSEPPEEDGERWEQIAFSIYTDLCEVESIARAALRVEGDA